MPPVDNCMKFAEHNSDAYNSPLRAALAKVLSSRVVHAGDGIGNVSRP